MLSGRFRRERRGVWGRLLMKRRIVDNLPGATAFVTMDKSKKYYAAGFKLGVFQNNVGLGGGCCARDGC